MSKLREFIGLVGTMVGLRSRPEPELHGIPAGLALPEPVRLFPRPSLLKRVRKQYRRPGPIHRSHYEKAGAGK